MAAEATGTDGQVGTEQGSRPRLYLHVGLPKTGTTFLQAALRAHREELLENGFCYPSLHEGAMFHASVEMTRSYKRWGLSPEKVDGTFGRLVEQGRESGRTVIISHEGFGRARPDDVERIKEYLSGFEVHVVITVRDIGRTLTAGWQEWVKNGGGDTFEVFTDRMVGRIPKGLEGSGSFWTSQNIEDTLRRWAVVAPPERTHVVICPQGGAPRDELWNRFAAALELRPDLVDLDAVERVNESLGAPQIALLRQVNVALGDRLPQPWHSRVSKRWFAQKLLSQVASGKPGTPPEVAAKFEEVSRRWIDGLVDGGHRTYGDLADLEIQAARPGDRHPDDVSAEEVLAGLPLVFADMLVKVREQNAERTEQQKKSRERIQELQRRLRATEKRLEDAEAELHLRRRFWPFKVGPQRRTDVR